MKRKSNEREIKIPVKTMADEVISRLGFICVAIIALAIYLRFFI